jgi:Ca2+-binding RTX toxin-like protein
VQEEKEEAQAASASSLQEEEKEEGTAMRRRSLGLLLFLATLLVAPAASQAAVTCDFNGGTGALTVTVTNGTSLVALGRDVSPNTDVLVDDAGDLSSPAVCTGGTPTLTTTSAITVDETGSSQDTTLVLNFVNGRLEPGQGAESGIPEIEITYDADTFGTDQIQVNGSTESAAQAFRFGAVGADIGGNLNGDNDIDDITAVGADQLLGQPGTGGDTVTADGSGSGSFTGPVPAQFTVFSSMGDDTLTAGAGPSSMNGGPDDDTITGGANSDTGDIAEGNDSYDGKGGVDFISYSQFPTATGVTLDMGQTGVQNTFGAGMDRVANAENIVGSNGSDTLTGTSGPNTMFGGNQPGDTGDDVLYGAGGADSLIGRPGNDTLIGGAGDDILFGEAGNDTASFALGSTANIGFSLDPTLTGVSQFTTGAGNDILADSTAAGDPDSNHEVENLTGTPFQADALVGNLLNNRINALDGLSDNVDCVNAGGDSDTAIVDEPGVDSTTNCEIVDTAPQTSIDTGPTDGATTNDPTPSYGVSANEPSDFQYQVDSAPFLPCTGTSCDVAPLADGTHTISVRAIDQGPNMVTDQTPASRQITIDATAPDTSITAGPSGPTSDSTPTFAFSSTEAPATFECKLDGAVFSACSSPSTTVALADGSHTFSVRSTDGVANTDASPATRTFTVDTKAPDTTVEGPAKLKLKKKKRTQTATYAFLSTEANGTFQCSLDGAAFTSCNPSHSVALRKGTHILSVRATDAAGNQDSSPATLTTRVVKKKPKK